MSKTEEYQNKMLSEVFSKTEILAAALFFFRKIDDIDFLVLEGIIRRKLGLSVGVPAVEKPLHESIEGLSEYIEITSREGKDNKRIYSYEVPISRGLGQTASDKRGVSKFFGEELYEIFKEICINSKEFTLRRVSIDPSASNLSNYVQEQDVRDLITEDLLIKSQNDTEKSYSLTEKGRLYLLAIEYEYEINNMRNILFGINCECKYLQEYLTHIYRGEIQGFYTFVSRLDWKWYLYFCKQNGYNDLIVEPVSDSKDHGTKVYPQPALTDDKK